MMDLEISLFHFLNGLSGQYSLLDWIMLTLSNSNFWIGVGAVLFLVAFRTKNSFLLGVLLGSLMALGASDLISFEIIKPMVARERPCWLIEARLIHGKCGGSFGFTSNHAANAFAVWTVVARSFGLRSWAAQVTITLATLVAISRVYLGVHFFGDILGGALLGVLVASSLWALGLEKLAGTISRKIMAADPKIDQLP